MSDGRKKKKKVSKKLSLSDEDDEEVEVAQGPTLESQFIAYVKYGDAESPGTHITLTEIDFWLERAGIINVRKLTRTDTGICYFHFKKYKLDFDNFKEFIELLANRKKVSADEIREKLIQCDPPSLEDEKKIIK